MFLCDFKCIDCVGVELCCEFGLLVYVVVCDYVLLLVSVFDVEIICDMDWVMVWIIVLQVDQVLMVLKVLKDFIGEFCCLFVCGMWLCWVFELCFKYDDLVDKGECIEILLCQDLLFVVFVDLID